jgi:hypothetical protein
MQAYDVAQLQANYASLLTMFLEAGCIIYSRASRAGQSIAALGLELSRRGGKNGKKRAVIARNLAVLLHKLWVSGEAYEPLYRIESSRVI